MIPPLKFRPLAWRLLVNILLVSGALTLIATGVQLYVEYRADLAEIASQVRQVEGSYLPVVRESVWDLNTRQTHAILLGILELPDMARVTLWDETGALVFDLARRTSGLRQVHTFPLIQEEPDGRRHPLGRLILTVSLEGVYQRLEHRLLVILGTQAAKTFLVSAAILLLFQLLLFRHLNRVIGYTERLDMETLERPLALARRAPLPGEPEDELNALVGAINGMRQRILEEHRQREEDRQALRHSEAQYRRLVENLSGDYLIYRHDTQGQFTYVSPSVTRVLGFTQEAFLTHYTTHLPDTPLNRRAIAYTEMSMAGHKPPPYQLETRAGDGVLHRLEVNESPIFDGRGKVIGVEGIARDVTQSVKLEEERRARQAAEAANQAKSAFLANMSHEIRTPMNGILGLASILEGRPLGAEEREYVGAIRHSTEQLLTIINDILDFSRIEAGKLQLVTAPFRLEEVVRQVVGLLAPVARNKGLTLGAQLPSPPLPAVLGDANRVRQVLLNLVGNGIKFTTRGTVTVTLTPLPDDDARGNGVNIPLRLTVADSGPGIAAVEREQLFEPFHQGPGSRRRAHSGSGLGLSITRDLVRLMGGGLELESRLGQGSRFHVTLLLPRAESGAVLPDREEEPPLERPDLNGLQVLLVEDHDVSRLVATTLLTEAGAVVTSARHGGEALSLFRPRRFDAVLMDIQMPGMDGLEVAHRVRQREAEEEEAPRVPILAVTANALPGIVARYRAAGMDGHLAKPYRPSALFRQLARITGRGGPPPGENDAAPAAGPPLERMAAPAPGMTAPSPSPPPGTPAADVPDLAKREQGAAGAGVPAAAGADLAGLALLDRAAGLAVMEGDEAIYAVILTALWNARDHYLGQLRQAEEAGDVPVILRLAHTLKGDAGGAGAPRLQEAARQLEMACRAGEEPARLAPRLALLERVFRDTLTALDAADGEAFPNAEQGRPTTEGP